MKLPLDTTGSVELDVDLSGQGEAIVAAANGFFGEYQLDAKLHSNSLSSLDGMEVAIQSKGPSIGNLAVIAGLTNWPDSPYELDIRAKHADHEIDIQSLRLDTKDLEVNGSGIVRTERGFRDIDLELNATGSNLASVAPLLKLDSGGQQPFSLELVISGIVR